MQRTTRTSRTRIERGIARWGSLAVILTWTMAGCGPSDSQATATTADSTSTTATPAVDRTSELRARAEKLWAARASQDWNAAFDFLHPVIQARSTRERFVEWSIAEEPLNIHAYSIQDVQTEGDFGWLDMKNSVSMRKMPGDTPREFRTTEKWLLVDGLWYPIPKEQFENYPDMPSRRNGSEEVRLRERFEIAAQLRAQADWPALFEMVDPVDRESLKLDLFERNLDAIRVLGHEVLWIEVINDRGRVRVRYMQRINDPNLAKLKPEPYELTERWISRDGVWFLDPAENKPSTDRSTSS